VIHSETFIKLADLIKPGREHNPSISNELHLGSKAAAKLETAIRETLEANIAEWLHSVVFRRKWRDKR
jgi:hypothetical protein